MIDINLIPASLRKNGKSEAITLAINYPPETLIGVGVGLGLFIMTIHLILGAFWLVGMFRLSNVQANWQKLADDKTVLDTIDAESKDLKKKFNMIADMTTKKSVQWTPKLNTISDVLTRGLWLRKMSLDKMGLSMEGSVVSKSQNEINNVGLFLSALRQNNEFMKDFSSLEVNSIQRGKNNSIEVTDFTVMAKLNEIKPDESKHK